MNRRTFLSAVPATLLATRFAGLTMSADDGTSTGGSGGGAAGAAGPLKPIALPKPETEGGLSVLAALKERRTIRSIKPDPLPLQVLSNVLWAGFGVNREKGPFEMLGRTAASASNA